MHWMREIIRWMKFKNFIAVHFGWFLLLLIWICRREKMGGELQTNANDALLDNLLVSMYKCKSWNFFCISQTRTLHKFKNFRTAVDCSCLNTQCRVNSSTIDMHDAKILCNNNNSYCVRLWRKKTATRPDCNNWKMGIMHITI